MEFEFAKEVNVLGEKFTIEIRKPENDPIFRNRHPNAYGYCDYFGKTIVLSDRSEKEEFKHVKKEHIVNHMKNVLRHEIVHAFLLGSGLNTNTKYNGNWALNEEMVDWIAFQGPKLLEAWKEAGAL